MKTMKRLLFALVMLLSCAVRATFAQDLLEPEKAFQFSARLVDRQQVEVRYVIAPG